MFLYPSLFKGQTSNNEGGSTFNNFFNIFCNFPTVFFGPNLFRFHLYFMWIYADDNLGYGNYGYDAIFCLLKEF